MLKGALTAGAFNAISYLSADRDALRQCLGMDNHGYRLTEALKMVHDVSEAQMPRLIYAMFGDDTKERFARGCGRGSMPVHETNLQMTALYDWLESLGYQLSDEEHELLDGTHPVFCGGGGA